jgi:DAK2 domain fusion protein YloV
MDSQEAAGTQRDARSFRDAPIDGRALKYLVEAGLTWLRANQQLVNSLNVFPVPDGDTGTNMVLTMQSAFDEIANSQERNFGRMAHAVANGALMGARGNSGVILSQLWRGFARGVDSEEVLDAASMARAFALARDTAYRGVVRPVEGTILTVAKDIASAAEESLAQTDDPYEVLDAIVAAADRSVQNTPELLPVLKEAGVVDSGGKGYFIILEGMLRYANGQTLEAPSTIVVPLSAMQLEDTLELVEPGQDFEVVVDFKPDLPLDLERFYQDLEAMGTSIQIGEGDGIYRLHIHVPTENLYQPTNYAQSLGTMIKSSTENLIYQMNDLKGANKTGKLNLPAVEAGQIAVVAVSPGVGISRVFASLGVAAIVEGGQTMNPSTQEILGAFENLPTDNIIILPNNKNIILTANAVAEISDKNIAVIPSRSIPQGLAAMMRLAPEGDFDEVVVEMTSALDEVETGEITTATRSVEIDGVETKEGQIIVLHNGNLILSAANLEQGCLGFLEKVHAEKYELITLFYGAALEKEEVNNIVQVIQKSYPEQEIEVQDGGQPHYYFIIAVE